MTPIRFKVDEILEEREKAWRVSINGLPTWLPKSHCKMHDVEDEKFIDIPNWLSKEKQLHHNGAFFSEDKKYRYALWRTWDDNKKIALVIMLNPSTANERSDDPTIRYLTWALKELDFGGYRVVNLFTLVSSKPEILEDVTKLKKIEEDLGMICMQALFTQDIIFAWGTFEGAEYRAKKVIPIFPEAMCFGKNKNGTPWHPMALMYKGLKKKKSELQLCRYSNNTIVYEKMPF